MRTMWMEAELRSACAWVSRAFFAPNGLRRRTRETAVLRPETNAFFIGRMAMMS